MYSQYELQGAISSSISVTHVLTATFRTVGSSLGDERYSQSHPSTRTSLVRPHLVGWYIYLFFGPVVDSTGIQDQHDRRDVHKLSQARRMVLSICLGTVLWAYENRCMNASSNNSPAFASSSCRSIFTHLSLPRLSHVSFNSAFT